jgi:hypothetical protein
MEELYRQPISPARFQAYLKLLQGEKKGDMRLPIVGYNPMAKGHVLEKIKQLQELEAEKQMVEALREVNATLPATKTQKFSLLLIGGLSHNTNCI